MTKRSNEIPATDRILRPAEVAVRIGFRCRQSVYNLVREGLLPPPFKIGKRASGWRESTLIEFMRQREAASRQIV